MLLPRNETAVPIRLLFPGAQYTRQSVVAAVIAVTIRAKSHHATDKSTCH